MAQIFHRSTNFLSRFSIFGSVFFLAILLWLFYDLEASPYTTQQTIAREQPVQFSHAHHVGGEGGVRRDSAHEDVHELPLADLGAEPVPRAGPGELPHRQVARVDARQR